MAVDDAHRGITMVPPIEEHRLIKSILCRLGASEDEAEVQADLLVEADLRGHSSHGLQRLPVIVNRIANGVMVPRSAITTSWLGPAFLKVDGGKGFGPVVAFQAIELISERARSTGVALAAISNSNHLGMLAPYVERIARAEQVGIALTTSEALVHSFGGSKKMIGTNPLAVAVPGGARPFVLDMATSRVSMGEILACRDLDKVIPLDWALDQEGKATSDASEAANGSINPFGGAKGYGLALAIELVVATLTSSALGLKIRGTLDPTEQCTKGDVFLAVDAASMGISDIRLEATTYLGEIRAERDGRGCSVDVPGDRSSRLRQERLATGVPVAEQLWLRLQSTLRELT